MKIIGIWLLLAAAITGIMSGLTNRIDLIPYSILWAIIGHALVTASNR